MQIKNIEQWQHYVITHWADIRREIENLTFDNHYKLLVAIALMPVFPKNQSQLDDLMNLLESLNLSSALRQYFLESMPVSDKQINALKPMVDRLYAKLSYDEQFQYDVDQLILATGAFAGVRQYADQIDQFCRDTLAYFREIHRRPSGVSVQAEMIRAGNDIFIAGRDINITLQYFSGDNLALKKYLSEVRAEWDYVELGKIRPEASKQLQNAIRLHHLYTPIDIWLPCFFEAVSDQVLSERRSRAVEEDMHSFRASALEMVAAHPLIVITGGAGTGKSTLCRHLATCLAYAIDPDAEQADHVSGLALLGPSWIHGALLPLYVNLRQFSSDKTVFPLDYETARAQHLLSYLEEKHAALRGYLEQYLLNAELPTAGAILLLDGLDEVYAAEDRRILRKMVENWVDRFPKCRVVVTTRTYAYRTNDPGRLSERFTVFELAPYTWKQIKTYVENWYSIAAMMRPASFGGRDSAPAVTQQLARNLVTNILNTSSLWSLARVPLLLTLMTLIHEENKKLPDNRAELYEKTVVLLHKWNPPREGDPLAVRLAHLNFDQVRAALQLTAFDLQRDHVIYEQYPATITRSKLLEHLLNFSLGEGDLGANVEDVLEYLGTRNGILVSEGIAAYRFLHLSVQEYMAACALIEQYDECRMPDDIGQAASSEDWRFPGNVRDLLEHDPFRWREVALFAGSILSSNKGQDLRWNYIEELLPETCSEKVTEGSLHRIYVAAEVWGERWLKPRLRSHATIRQQLSNCLAGIIVDDRLDVPERVRAITILGQLETDS